MEIIDLLTVRNTAYWLNQIRKADWEAAKFLFELVAENKVSELLGEAKILMLVNGCELISFCTFAEKDDIKETNLSPWLGFVYTYPKYRGYHYMQKLINKACLLAKEKEHKAIYVSTSEMGLYEKYGFTFYQSLKDINGNNSRVYIKTL